MKTLNHPHRISVLRALLLMTIVAVLKPAATITTVSPEENGKPNLASEAPQMKLYQTDVKMNFTTKATPFTFSSEERNENIENTKISTKKDSWTTPRTRLTGEPSAPERGISTLPEFFITGNKTTQSKEWNESTISLFPNKILEKTVLSSVLHKNNTLQASNLSSKTFHTRLTSPQTISTEIFEERTTNRKDIGKESEIITLDTRIPKNFNNNNSRHFKSNRSTFNIALESESYSGTSETLNKIPLNSSSIGRGSIPELIRESTNATLLEIDVGSTKNTHFKSTSGKTNINSTVSVTSTNTTRLATKSFKTNMTTTVTVVPMNTITSESTSNIEKESTETVAPTKTTTLQSKLSKTDITSPVTIEPTYTITLESEDKSITSTEMIASTNTTPSESTLEKTVKTSTVNVISFNTILAKEETLTEIVASTNKTQSNSKLGKTHVKPTETITSASTTPIELTSSNTEKKSIVTLESTKNTKLEPIKSKTDITSTVTVASTSAKPLKSTLAKVDITPTEVVTSTYNTPLDSTSTNTDKTSMVIVKSTNTTKLESISTKPDTTFTVTLASTNKTPLESTLAKTDITPTDTVKSTNNTPIDFISSNTDKTSTVTVASTSKTPLESTLAKTDLTPTEIITSGNTTPRYEKPQNTRKTSMVTADLTNTTRLESITKYYITSTVTLASTKSTQLESTLAKTDVTSKKTVASIITTPQESTSATLKNPKEIIPSSSTTPLDTKSQRTTSIANEASINTTPQEPTSAKIDINSTENVASTNTISSKTDIKSTLTVASTNITPLELTTVKIEKLLPENIASTMTTQLESTSEKPGKAFTVSVALTNTKPLDSLLTKNDNTPTETVTSTKKPLESITENTDKPSTVIEGLLNKTKMMDSTTTEAKASANTIPLESTSTHIDTTSAVTVPSINPRTLGSTSAYINTISSVTESSSNTKPLDSTSMITNTKSTILRVSTSMTTKLRSTLKPSSKESLLNAYSISNNTNLESSHPLLESIIRNTKSSPEITYSKTYLSSSAPSRATYRELTTENLESTSNVTLRLSKILSQESRTINKESSTKQTSEPSKTNIEPPDKTTKPKAILPLTTINTEASYIPSHTIFRVTSTTSPSVSKAAVNYDSFIITTEPSYSQIPEVTPQVTLKSIFTKSTTKSINFTTPANPNHKLETMLPNTTVENSEKTSNPSARQKILTKSKLNTVETTRKSIFTEGIKKRPDTNTEKYISNDSLVPTKWTTLKENSVQMIFLSNTNEHKEITPVEIKKDTIRILAKPTLLLRTKEKETQVQINFQTDENISTESYHIPRKSQDKTYESSEILTQPSVLFQSNYEKVSTDWSISKRKKIKLPKHDLSHKTTEHFALINQESKTTGKNSTSTNILKSDNSLLTTVSPTETLLEITTKNQWYLLNFNNREGKNYETKLELPKGELIYHRKLTIKPTSRIDYSTKTLIEVNNKTFRANNITNKKFGKTVLKSNSPVRNIKTNKTVKSDPNKNRKGLPENKSIYPSKSVEKTKYDNRKTLIVNKNENKGNINRIEEILLNYYEAFKKRNTTNNHVQKNNKKSVPVKRKFKIKKRPVTNDTKESGMPLCIKPTVVNRRYLNSSYMLLTYILKEHFINYRSLEYLDLSHNEIRRFNLSTLNNLNTLKYLRLESNNLTDLYPINFYTLRNLEYLDLSNNFISKIRNFTFTNMKSLKYLNLNANVISKINATTLRGLQGLTHLDLSKNIIEYIHEDSLPKILSIKYLNLSSNKISTLAIKNIKNIQTVDLSYNEINSLGNITLGNLTNQMKVLKLNNNLLEHLNENIFRNFTKLIYLDVSNNKLNYISPSTFQYLNNLIFLNISCQNILSIDKMKNFTYSTAKNNNNVIGNDENYSKVPTILRNITIPFTKIQNKNYYYESFTEKGGKSNDSTIIINYQKDIKSNLSAININRTRNFSKNKQSKETNQKESKQTMNNRIMKRTNLIDKNKSKLIYSELNVSRYKEYKNKTQKVIESNISNLTNINYFKLISNLTSTNYFKLDLLASISQRLKHFECTELNLSQVPQVLTHSIQILNLKLNKIKILKLGDLDDYPLLQILILSQNKIKSIETDSLGRLDYLRILLVDKNKLKSIPLSLPENIKILNLNFNIISRIKQEDFFDLVNLEELYLQSNKIEYIPPNTFTFLKNLKRLDMSNNPIRTMNSIVLAKLNFINLSNLKQIQSNYSERFPVEDGYSLIGVKLSNSDELCRLLLDDYAFVLTLKQIKYLNCGQTESEDESDLQEINKRRNETCEPSKITQEHPTQILNTREPKSSVTNRRRVKFISSRKMMNIDQTKGCVNNESDVSQIINSNMVRKRSNKGYSKTINTNLNVNNDILLNVNKCTICKVDKIYEPLFEFDFANVESYIENIISFANVLNYANIRSYLQHAMEEQQGNCLQRSDNSRGGYVRRTYDVENYTPMNNSTDVLTFPMRNNRRSFANKRKTSSNRILSKGNFENEGISVITKDTDILSADFFPSREKSSRYYSSVTNQNRYLENMDFELSDQASVQENSTNDLIKINNKQKYNKENNKIEESNKPSGEENKFSIVKDNKKNVILKLNRNINNETEDKQTKYYDQLETKEPSKTTNNKENEKHKVLGFEGNLIKDNKKVTIGKKGNIIQPSEYNTKRQEEIKYGRMVDDQKRVLDSSHDIVYRTLNSDQSVNKSNQSEQISSKIIEEYKIRADGKTITENTNNKYNQIDHNVLSDVKNDPMNGKVFETQRRTKNDPNNERGTNKQELFSANFNSHKDAQYEMNIVDTDAEFLDIIDDKTEKIINENTVRTLETSKYHELVSQNTLEGMQYHTGMIIFLMIVVLMIVAAFLALTFQWNTLLHYYCHNYVSYRNNGQSDDEEHSDSNLDRIEMLDNADVYSIT